MAKQNEMINSDEAVVGSFQEINSDLTDNSATRLKKMVGMALGALAVVVVVIVTVVFYNNSKSEKEQEASAALSRIRTEYESGDYSKAISGDPAKLVRNTPVMGLKEIVEQFGNTENGKVAALYAGNSLLSLNKQGDAVEYFEKAQGSSSVEVVVGAMVGLAICKETLKDYSSAGDYYERAAQQTLQTATRDKFRLYAAMSFEKAGNKDKAEKLYRDILHSETMEYISESKSGLTRLGMIVE